ncbi:MAG: hypothetical protein Q8Q62_13950 [Mesorhizobium sp.]|nr:hypothetical protein [Mesorhizobium sp.]
MAGDAAAAPTGAPRNAVLRYLARFDDGLVIRWAFFGMLIGTLGVLGMDLYEMSARDAAAIPAGSAIDEPVLPPAVETATPSAPGRDPREFLTTDEAALKGAMRFALGTGGVLAAEGAIEPGAAERFAAEIAARGEYVKTIALNSPGGSLEDAMAMSRLIRDQGFATEVADGALCASSCPLIMAGGVERRAGARAAIGVHQFYSAGEGPKGPAQAMSDAQATTARITRHLTEMGVDPALWLHALDTPPRALDYVTVEELGEYRLATVSMPVAKQQ